MVIEIGRDIDRYKETVAMGLTAKQLVFSAASVTIGGGLVLGLQFFIGMTLAVYIAIPVAAPIALGGFYSYNGMGFYEYMGRKLKMMFANRTLLYSSTEGGEAVREMQAEKMAEKKKADKKRRKKKKKKTVKILTGTLLAVMTGTEVAVQIPLCTCGNERSF